MASRTNVLCENASFRHKALCSTDLLLSISSHSPFGHFQLCIVGALSPCIVYFVAFRARHKSMRWSPIIRRIRSCSHWYTALVFITDNRYQQRRRHKRMLNRILMEHLEGNEFDDYFLCFSIPIPHSNPFGMDEMKRERISNSHCHDLHRIRN